MSNLAEKNMTVDTIKNNEVQEYNWPYSQPRILNVVRATSRFGLFLGLFSLLLVFDEIYSTSGLFIIDAFLMLSFIVLRCGFIPAVRRAEIKYVASESRTFNKIMLIILCTLMYSAMIRFFVASGLVLFNNGFNFNDYFYTVIENWNWTILAIGASLVIFPPVFMLLPKDVNVSEYHFTVRNLINQVEYAMATDENAVPVYTKRRAPNTNYASYNGPRNTSAPSPVYAPAPSNSNTTKNKTNNKNNTPKKPKQKTVKESSVWDSEKSVRRPRK